MELHGSAVLSQRQRRRLVLLVGSGMAVTSAAAVVGCSRQTGSKWVNRDRRGEGLTDRSSRPRRDWLGDGGCCLDGARDLAPARSLEVEAAPAPRRDRPLRA